ncbi:MAG: UDP-N-acetylmuramoylalanyl-D-glutamate--2,6-diaminopimelate ligase, partial [Treponemataceae bacterium]|nr:UDP-N-acetylmuramoylalanyl-D-glutamate--2,6-diaminopimelate ligase [Treponemataceae bacterium]
MGGEEESLLTFEELIRAVFGNRIGSGASNSLCFTSVATDSRNVKKGSLFIPLIGQNQDGHKFIPQALAAGARAVFVTKSVYEISPREFDSLAEKNPGVFFIVVENNLRALQDAARAYVEKFSSLIKIGITGSSGKTTTKEILSAILAQKFRVVSTVGNLNSESGLPLSVFEIREGHEAGVFEMGMNRENEIAEIASVLRPNFAIVTNVGTAHIGILKTREKIAAEKKNIFSYVTESGIALFPEDDDFAEFLAKGVRGKILRFGKKSAENFGVKFLEDLGIGGTRFEIDGIETCLKIPGSHNFQNALSCIALAKELGLSAQEIIR